MCPHLASPLWVVLAGSIVQIATSGHWKFHDRFQRSVSVISTRVSWQATNAAVALNTKALEVGTATCGSRDLLFAFYPDSPAVASHDLCPAASADVSRGASHGR